MLSIDVIGGEMYDDDRNEFLEVEPVTLRLEHSLVSISKWESKWRKPFLDRKKKTSEEFRDYVRCMTLNQNIDPYVYQVLSSGNLKAIDDYIGSELTATTITNPAGKSPSREIVTSEVIYYWMVAYNIPWEAQKWHLSRLITLISICSIKNAPPKKMSKQAVMSRNARLNAARRKRLNSKG